MGQACLFRAVGASHGRAEKQCAAMSFVRSSLRTCVMQHSSGFVIKCLAVVLIGLVQQPSTVRAVTNGYVTAFLTSECSSAPHPPPPGEIATGPDYVIMTVADADPRDFGAAQQLVTDAVFESLMPRYCALPQNSGIGCVTNRVQWAIRTFEENENSTISGWAKGGCPFLYCSPTPEYIPAVMGGPGAALPAPPPVGLTAVGS